LDPDKVQAQIAEIRHSIERSIPTGFHEHKASNESWEGWGDAPTYVEKDLLAKARRQLGTLGGGNHFIEVCFDKDRAVWVMLHSGSRHVGLQIARRHTTYAKQLMKDLHVKMDDVELAFIPANDPDFAAYWHDLQWAQAYAMENRAEMARRILHDLSYSVNERRNVRTSDVVNCHHNYAEWETHFGEKVIVTRKGAIRAQVGDMGIIPGSMGAKSFIVRGLGNPDSFMSASHGAGRRMSRKVAKNTFTVADLEAAMVGIEGRKDAGVLDEAPGAYKDIDTVIANESDLVEVVTELKQIMSIKGAE